MTELAISPGEQRMKLQYGVNQADQCWDFAIGPERERIWARLREIDTRMVRLFLFDKGAPDHVKDWDTLAAYVQAVLNIGANPMMTFAKFRPPFDDPWSVRAFADRSADVVRRCIDQWGGETVRDWYWCVWNEPNNSWISDGELTFEHYRRIYEQVAYDVLKQLDPCLKGRKPLIGGPAVEGFPNFWWDWPWRFVNEIDNALIGFVDWHRYADWRDAGENGAPQNETVYRGLIASRALDFQFRARAIGQQIRGREILNICGELNCHSHYTKPVRERFNFSIFGATFYVAALLNLMRGEADAEMFWVGTEADGGYGMLDQHGQPKPVFHAKKLCTQHVQYGDMISFAPWDRGGMPLDAVVARGNDGRLSAMLVHLSDKQATYPLSGLVNELSNCDILLKMDEGTGNGVISGKYDGRVTFEGYGVAVVTNKTPEVCAS
jgi:Glycosyl hydrolases family 39